MILKTHLNVPGTIDSLCGRKGLKQTEHPEEVTCKHCRGYYNYNASYYLSKLRLEQARELFLLTERMMEKYEITLTPEQREYMLIAFVGRAGV